jgi:3' exoribonuclease, RNase T-like
MKYFIDTEFIEGFHKPLFGKRRHFIDLVSIAIIAEDGREYYAVSNEWKYKDAEEWVKENVLSMLPTNMEFKYKNNAMIAHEVQRFVSGDEKVEFIESDGAAHLTERAKRIIQQGYTEPEFYGYYSDYDWVVFCSLFGRMIDLPKGFPMYCKDLKQYFDDMQNLCKYDLKQQPDYPKQDYEHSALDDAKWNVQLYKFLQKISKTNL